MQARLRGKAALVTGGSRGIGAAIAVRLAREGASVAFTYYASPEKAEAVARSIEATGGVCLPICADSGDPEAVAGAVAATAEAFGRLDILVNNAGLGAPATIDQMSLEDFDRCFAVNVRSVFVAIRAAAPLLPKGGRIITIGSVNGDRTPFQGGAAYAASKAAVAGLTRGAARDLGARGVTVNVVQPGPVDTDMNPADGPWAPAALAQLATGAFGAPTDVAALVAFLASEEAGFITGASLNIDGGYMA